MTSLGAVTTPSTTVADVCALIASSEGAAIYETLIPSLKRLDKSISNRTAPTGALEGLLPNGADPLAVLDTFACSAGYLFILNARCSVAAPDLDVLMPFVKTFTETFDRNQLALIPEQVVFFATNLAQMGALVRNPGLVAVPLMHLIQGMPLQGVLTSMHPIFFHIVLESRSYHLAKNILRSPVMSVYPEKYPIKYQDHLLFHYLGGTILALLGDYSEASHLLEICVSAPGSAVSAIQIDAYKKLLLVQLLDKGQTRALPKFTSTPVVTACKNLCTPYTDYANAYATHDRARKQDILDRNRAVFTKDLNDGLIIYCERAFLRRAIKKLTDTFITLSLVDIATAVNVSLDEAGLRFAQQQLLAMIANEEIHGSLSQSDPNDPTSVVVTFVDDPEPFNSHSIVDRLNNEIRSAADLELFLDNQSKRTEATPEFVSKAYTAAQGSGQAFEDVDMASGWEGEN